MKTDDLIAALSADTRPPPALRRSLLIALAAAAIVAGIVWLAMLGPRPDFMPAMHTPRFVFKFVFALTLASTAAVLAFPMAQPFDRASPLRPLLLAAPVLLLVAVSVELFMIPSGDWMRLWMGHNARVCMMSIPAIAALPLALMLYALHQAAPARPARAGAIAGVIAGGMAAFFYAAHCFDDSPLFVATWYSIAIGFVSGVGALVGAKVLRW